MSLANQDIKNEIRGAGLYPVSYTHLEPVQNPAQNRVPLPQAFQSQLTAYPNALANDA